MAPPIQILVHPSGPSLGQDDARYRSQALAFLQFEVAERHTLLGPASHTPNAVQQTHSRIGTTNAEEVQPSRVEKAAHKWTPAFSRPTASTLPWTTTKQIPHLLIERTPALPRPRTAPTQSTPSQAPRLRRSQSDSWNTPPSVIPDSQPTPPSSRLPERSSSPYLKRPFDSSSPSPTRRASPPPAKRPRLQIPSSPPSENPPVEAPPRATPHLSSRSSTKRPRPAVPSSPPSENPAVEAPSPAAAPTWSPNAESPPASSPPPNDTPRGALEIHPRRPKTTNRPFKTHLTKSLAEVAAKLPLEEKFKPITTCTRTPRVLERGHWLVPMDGFDEKVKKELWDHLRTFVGGGQAGWGTWCVWEFEEPMRGKDGDKGNRAPRHREVVKVYCWGEVVGEIWLLLFIFSGKKVRDTDAQWVDAGGEAVVFMNMKKL